MNYRKLQKDSKKNLNQQTDDTDGNVVQLYTIKCSHQMVIIPAPDTAHMTGTT